MPPLKILLVAGARPTFMKIAPVIHAIRRHTDNLAPDAAADLGTRDIAAIARAPEFNAQPDALCVSGLIAGAETDAGTLAAVKGAVQRTPVFANTGVRADNVAAQLAIADGAIVGTTFKVDGYIWSDVDERRVAEFMQAARDARG